MIQRDSGTSVSSGEVRRKSKWHWAAVKIGVMLVLGAILATAQWFSPALLPWVIAYLLACFGVNLQRTLLGKSPVTDRRISE